MILGTIISVFLFDFHLTAQFAWGAALVISSAYMYGVYSLALLSPPRPPRSPRTHPHATPSHPHPAPPPRPPTRSPRPGRVAMKDDAASEDSTTSALNCRDSFINCLGFLDCFSDANSARGKARRPRLLTPYLLPCPSCPTPPRTARLHACTPIRPHTSGCCRAGRLGERVRGRVGACAMSLLTPEAAERREGPRGRSAPRRGGGAPKQVRIPADPSGPHTDRLRSTSRS